MKEDTHYISEQGFVLVDSIFNVLPPAERASNVVKYGLFVPTRLGLIGDFSSSDCPSSGFDFMKI